MELILIRHAIAEDREKWSGDDDSRPLTQEGIARMEQVSRGLKGLLEDFDAVYSSPLKRARQTAEILLKVYKSTCPLYVVEELRPEAEPKDFLKVIDYSLRRVVAVGHEPHVGHLAGLLIGSTVPFSFKKAAAACFEFLEPQARNSARLLWFVPPKLLRK
ncbi:MAG: phosphohistidine phosphatase SixA [Acidobacteriota bacterium]|nr:phosphohistidine phosphatase SixA [Blastocatellia bacterium]MDW8412529.1 phosphohistidine phosphatase SixA [Acidobacteriota bacterium]